ncbi:Phosphopantothenoylcysteine decarboxylase / Phosphopantothenate--cysteine ligase [Gammaproteobacteria bacterium]
MQNKNIILGITGGIAAYKAAELVRMLQVQGAKVRVIMTKNACEFITPLTMQTLSGHTVYTEMFSQHLKTSLEHIALARWADAVVIAPASANFIAKLAHGLADDLLATTCLATTAPIAIAPAMNKEMYSAAITQKNIMALKNRQVFIFGPASGEQACGEVGFGRMLEPQQILELIPTMFASQLFYGKKIVITAGPTREAIDPVRYISNYSSGKMGYALAAAALEAGANVVLISGPTNLTASAKAKRIDVQTAEEMCQVVMQEVSACDVFIAAAAVADYRPKNVSAQKIKKHTVTVLLELQRNHDILAEVAALAYRPFVVGFAAETENLVENARSKLESKNLDMIIANQVGENLCFASDENSVIILCKNTKPLELPKMQKTKLARQIVKIIHEKIKGIHGNLLYR